MYGILNALKYLLAPIVAYFKGKKDQKLLDENYGYKKFIEESNKKHERRKKIRAKYDRVRASIRLRKPKGDIPKSEE